MTGKIEKVKAAIKQDTFILGAWEKSHSRLEKELRDELDTYLAATLSYDADCDWREARKAKEADLEKLETKIDDAKNGLRVARNWLKKQGGVKMTYQDTKKDAIKAARLSADFGDKDVCDAIADGYRPYCWMVLNFTTQEAVILWLDQPIGEDGYVEMDVLQFEDEEAEAQWIDACRVYLNAGGEAPKGANIPDGALA